MNNSHTILHAIGNTSLVQLNKVFPTDCANVIAAIKVAEQLGPDANIVTLMVDSGLTREITNFIF